jgi:hypothetical protein
MRGRYRLGCVAFRMTMRLHRLWHTQTVGINGAESGKSKQLVLYEKCSKDGDKKEEDTVQPSTPSDEPYSYPHI